MRTVSNVELADDHLQSTVCACCYNVASQGAPPNQTYQGGFAKACRDQGRVLSHYFVTCMDDSTLAVCDCISLDDNLPPVWLISDCVPSVTLCAAHSITGNACSVVPFELGCALRHVILQ